MAKLKQNSFGAFMGVVFATLTLVAFFALPSSLAAQFSVCDSTSYETFYPQNVQNFATPLEDLEQNESSNQYLDSNGPLQSPLFLGARRPFSQMSSRPQRGSLVFSFSGRDGALAKCVRLHVIKYISAFYVNAGFPSPLCYRVPKEYYVFTLKRILC